MRGEPGGVEEAAADAAKSLLARQATVLLLQQFHIGLCTQEQGGFLMAAENDIAVDMNIQIEIDIDRNIERNLGAMNLVGVHAFLSSKLLVTPQTCKFLLITLRQRVTEELKKNFLNKRPKKKNEC